jgi:hypothetical protein
VNQLHKLQNCKAKKLLVTHPSLFFSRCPQVRFDGVQIDFGHRRFNVVHIEASCNRNESAMILQDYTTYKGDVGSEGYSERNATREVWYMSTYKTTQRHTLKNSNINPLALEFSFKF